MKHLVLLGGGHAHVHVLRVLAAEPFAGVRTTLVSPYPRQVYSGMVPGYIAGHYALDDCVIPLLPLAERARATFVESSAVRLDAAARLVTLADGQVLHYDALSVDTGPVMDRDTISGAREHALFVRPIESFIRLWDAMVELAGQRPLAVVVVGAGAAGVELSMAIQHRLGTRARVSLVTGGGAPLGGLSKAVQARALRALKRSGVTVFEDSCTEITDSQVVLQRGMRLACDAPVLAIGASAPGWLAGSGLALDDAGFIATGATLQNPAHAEVFAAGDVSTRIDLPHPRSGVYAVRAGPPLALNLRRFLGGGPLEMHRPQKNALYLLACGERRAVGAYARWSFGGRWVWRWKDRIDRAFIAEARSTPTA
jgi:pyridine nucleotide-disulfide oxidoreductase family protein